VHINERLESEGVPCITGGAVCGKWWQGPNMGTYPGLGLIEIHPAQSTVALASSSVDWRYLNTPEGPEASFCT